MVQTNLAMLVPFLIATTLAFPQVILASSSYELPKFTSSSKYFGQSDPDIDVSKVNVSDNFGLINKYSWKDVIDSLSDNEKLFYIQRHGEGWHNIAPQNFSSADWDCYWQLQPGRDGVVWEDAELTPNGVQQIEKLSHQIQNHQKFALASKIFY